MHIDTPSGTFDIVAPARLRGKHIDMLLNGNIAYLVFHMSHCSIAPQMEHSNLLYPPANFVVGILFSRCLCVRPSVTFCFLNILKSHSWVFIKPCKHVHICKTNT